MTKLVITMWVRKIDISAMHNNYFLPSLAACAAAEDSEAEGEFT